jgi:hypothetical protein
MGNIKALDYLYSSILVYRELVENNSKIGSAAGLVSLRSRLECEAVNLGPSCILGSADCPGSYSYPYSE